MTILSSSRSFAGGTWNFSSSSQTGLTTLLKCLVFRVFFAAHVLQSLPNFYLKSRTSQCSNFPNRNSKSLVNSAKRRPKCMDLGYRANPQSSPCWYSSPRQHLYTVILALLFWHQRRWTGRPFHVSTFSVPAVFTYSVIITITRLGRLQLLENRGPENGLFSYHP